MSSLLGTQTLINLLHKIKTSKYRLCYMQSGGLYTCLLKASCGSKNNRPTPWLPKANRYFVRLFLNKPAYDPFIDTFRA